MSKRMITVDGKKWTYVIGHSFVKFVEPHTFLASISDVKGVRDDVFEKGQWRRTSDGMLTPKDVATYLRSRTG